MSDLVVLSPRDLETIVYASVVKAMAQQEVSTQPEWMNTREAAEYLRMGESRVYQLVAENAIPYSKVGKSNRYSRKALEEWLRAST